MTQLKTIPLLRAGDHLTVEEFELRYDAMPNVRKAELINGVVYMPSPVRAEEHGDPHFTVAGWLGRYEWKTPGTIGSDNATVRLQIGANQPQPDLHLRIEAERGGRTWMENGYVAGPPELVAEVAASSVNYDLHEKRDAFERNGIPEYIVWRIEDAAIDWFILRGNEYEKLALVEGVYRSEIFPGLWLDADALIRDDRKRLVRVARKGTASRVYATFVAKLANATK